MNPFFFLIISIITISYLLSVIIDIINVKHISSEIPVEFKDYINPDKYRESQNYLKDRTNLSLVTQTIDTIIIITIISFGLLNRLDLLFRSFTHNSIITGLFVIISLVLTLQLIHLPFSIYSTFWIEEKYKFNKTTIKTFTLDIIKGAVLGILIGTPVMAIILLFFEKFGSNAWLIAWIFITIIQMGMTLIAPILIMPLFNKFIPLEDSDLKSQIQHYADSQKFSLNGIFKMDGSRRSQKSNAFFTGFGKFRRVALFDTLIEKHSTDELVSILAHEIGHYKMRHIYKNMILSITFTGINLLCLSFFLNNPLLMAAAQIEHASIYMSMILFGLIFTPIDLLLSIVSNLISRHDEYQADKFAITTFPNVQAFINALKKLSVDNLTNLTPHPLKVWLEYSHPTAIDRIKAIQKHQNI